MTTTGSFDAPIGIFGGLVTDMSPADLPHGVSPDCQDVIFSNGNVATRPGLQALFGPLTGNPTINYVKTYETLNSTLRTMALDSNGILYKETTPGTLSSIAAGLAANAYANSTTLFGRKYTEGDLDALRAIHAAQASLGSGLGSTLAALPGAFL